ncbi:TPA: hypothetical protein HA219_01475 [Candidatus Woesearchaeota archaeon]|nr:hypothetical protein [Candidatus Woesearchaeota archaeon]HIH39377.1 hypothetical protein [Candidatus Woesearchaeota archaeon]
MSSIVFDTGPVISLATNNLLWLLGNLKERYKGDFVIPKDVQRELIEVPLEIKRFKLEALQVNREINKGNLTVVEDPRIQILEQELLSLANNCFKAKGFPVKIVQKGEMAAVAAAIVLNADAIVIDERTTRELIEDPERIIQLMSDKLKTRIEADKNCLAKIKSMIGNLKVIRSIELAMVGYDLGWFDKYLTDNKDARKDLKEAILWGIKIRGASISQEEIDKIVRMEK